MDKFFLDVARLTAKLSHAKRKQVGAVLAKDGRIVSIGYNGTPAGFDNCCEDKLEDGSLKTKKNVVHAESNALFFCAKTNIQACGATMYLTLSPCATCALAMIQSGVSRVVYIEPYTDLEGCRILEAAGVEVEQFTSQI